MGVTFCVGSGGVSGDWDGGRFRNWKCGPWGSSAEVRKVQAMVGASESNDVVVQLVWTKNSRCIRAMGHPDGSQAKHRRLVGTMCGS